jgi:hypothetical protein
MKRYMCGLCFSEISSRDGCCGESADLRKILEEREKEIEQLKKSLCIAVEQRDLWKLLSVFEKDAKDAALHEQRVTAKESE